MTSCSRKAAAHRNRIEAMADVIHAMQKQQSRYFATPPADQSPWRPMMIHWICSVVDAFDLMPWVVTTTLYYIDNAAPALAPTRPSDYQLLGLTSLQLAIKVHETKLFPMEELVKIGHSNFSTHQVISMEAKLLDALKFQLHPPSPECFLQQFLQLLPAKSRSPMWQRCVPLIRKALLQNFPIAYDSLAYACLLVAMEEERISTLSKQHVCWDMVSVSGLSATTPGLAAAYGALLPTRKTRPCPESPSRLQQVAKPSPSCSLPLSSYSVPPTNTATSQSHNNQAIVYCATEGTGFEVTWYQIDDSTQEKDRLGLSPSWSPRNVTTSNLQ